MRSPCNVTVSNVTVTFTAPAAAKLKRMEKPILDLQRLREHFAPHIFERGQKYQRSGEVLNLTLRGNTVSAGVQGSDNRPYRVTLTLSEDDLENADCTCPYGENFGELCKHIAAVALEVYFWPEHIVSEASVGKLLDPLDKPDLRGALDHLLRLHPEMSDELELYLQAQLSRKNQAKHVSNPEPSSTPPAEATLDTHLFEKLMQTAVRGAGQDWDGFPEYDEAYGVIEETKPFLERAAYRDALALTEALINTFISEVNSSEMNEYDNIGFSDEGIFDEFDKYLTEAVLGSTPGDNERKRLLYAVLAWNDQISNGWTSPSLSMAAHALAEGFETRDEEAQELLDEVARLEPGNAYSEIRLRVLRATNRNDEALAFAKTTGQGAEYLTVLLEQGKLAQVMSEYQEQLKNEQDALLMAQGLADAHPKEALEVAQYGLAQTGSEDTLHSVRENRLRELGLEFLSTSSTSNDRLALASFTKDLAGRLGDYKTTLEASLIEFSLSASLPRYDALQRLVGADWPRVQAELLKDLRQADYPNRYAAADIFLKEGLAADAVRLASRFSSDDTLLQKVMSAVIATHAPWVIASAKGRAEPIMNEGKSNHYDSAATWLGYVRSAHGASGQAAEWRAYIAGVREKHGRKYKLMGALESL